jgi:hypothetical protein
LYFTFRFGTNRTIAYRDKEVVGDNVRFRAAPLQWKKSAAPASQ